MLSLKTLSLNTLSLKTNIEKTVGKNTWKHPCRINNFLDVT